MSFSASRVVGSPDRGTGSRRDGPRRRRSFDFGAQKDTVSFVAVSSVQSRSTRARIRWRLVHTHEAPQLVCGSRSEGDLGNEVSQYSALYCEPRARPSASECLSRLTRSVTARNARIPASCDMYSQPLCLTLACTVFIHGSSRPPSPSSLTRWSGPHSAYEPLASARGSCQAGCAPCSRCTRRSVPPPRTALTGWPPRCTCRATPSGAP